MKFSSYDDYVVKTKKFYETRDLKIPIDHLIVSREVFDFFDGVIEWGVGSRCLINSDQSCTCNEDCDCVDIEKLHEEIEKIQIDPNDVFVGHTQM